MLSYEVKDYTCRTMNFKNFLLLFLFIFIVNIASAEIIDNQKVVNKEFGSWAVSCREDLMLGENNCKLFANVLDGTTIFVNPNNNANKIVIISKEISEGSKIIFRVDKNEIFESDAARNNEYGIVEMNVENKIKLLEQ